VVRWSDLRAFRPHLAGLLDSAELERRSSYIRADDRDRFTLAAALLRLSAAAELGHSPRKLQISRKCTQCGRPHGRPKIPGSDLHVSVSHSGTLVMVATTRIGPVGVDVEQVAGIDYLPLLPIVLAANENGAVSSARDFFTYWTRKESVLKATGDGLRMRMSDVEVTSPRETPRLLRYGNRQPVAVMADLMARPGYAAALTVLTNAPLTVQERAAVELFA
jgi:4'-phosphopantetheinyl transferase